MNPNFPNKNQSHSCFSVDESIIDISARRTRSGIVTCCEDTYFIVQFHDSPRERFQIDNNDDTIISEELYYSPLYEALYL